MKVKTFNLTDARNGHPLVTSGGEFVRFGAYLPNAVASKQVVILQEDGNAFFTNENGIPTHGQAEMRVFLREYTRPVFVNLFVGGEWKAFTSEGRAKMAASLRPIKPISEAVRVELTSDEYEKVVF